MGGGLISDFLFAHGHEVNIESEGAYAPERLLPEAIKVMRDKISTIRKAAEALQNISDSEDVEMKGE